jgi:hypothetical protein
MMFPWDRWTALLHNRSNEVTIKSYFIEFSVDLLNQAAIVKGFQLIITPTKFDV